MQDPNSNKQPLNQTPTFSTAMRSSHHRRAHSEVNFRLPEDLGMASDPFDAPADSFEEMGSEDDLFSTYMDMKKLTGGGSGVADSVFDNAGGAEDGDRGGSARPRHRHSNSVGSSSMLFESSSCIEAKKAMAPDKLAELWTVDPKRAKRILANRQSAARSKERKTRYISELERKVQMLQIEATTLSAQLTLFQRETTGLSNENMELKIRLQAMEQQAQLRDALNEALRNEVERLKIATGDISDTFNTAMQNISYNQSSFFSHQARPSPNYSQNVQMPQFHTLPAGMSSHQHSPLSNSFYQDPLGRFQGLDISSNRSSHLVKSEGPSVSANESSSSF